MNVVYIASLGHSGSTILDMALGCSPNAVGLGEVSTILRANRDELSNDPRFSHALCSCGSALADCTFWSRAKESLLAKENIAEYENYEKIMRVFCDEYGESATLLDSSKEPNNYLIPLHKHNNLKVIFLIRDVRSWSYSRRSRYGKSNLRLALQWYWGNKRLLKFLLDNDLNFSTLGYEEYALYPEYMLNQVCERVGIDFNSAMLTPGHSKSHIINGNVAKGDEEKRKSILYDARWMTANNMTLWNPAMLPLLRFNAQHVYSNFIKDRTKAFGLLQNDFLFFGDRRKEELRDQGWGLQ